MKTKLILASWLAGSLIAFATDSRKGSLVAHEWGTFTSVQGADGVQIEWNPFITADLPQFVYDRSRPGAGVLFLLEEGKDRVALQRMETPVIYFYSDEETLVDVQVRFPQGTVTEWYPQTVASTNRVTHWKNVAIQPKGTRGTLLNDGSSSHYYAARETDAALLRIAGHDGSAEDEKFLFYRGVGSFRAPLEVTMKSAQDAVYLHNAGTEELRHFFVLKIQGDRAGFAHFSRLAPDESKPVALHENRWNRPLSDVRSDIVAAMRQSLVAEGLYEREASAMIATWRESWFGEQGLRVFYVLPQTWADRTLPLAIEPRPREIVRVMVGRAEIITPSMEWELTKQIVKHAEGAPEAVAQFKALGIGRFADAAVRRMLGRAPSPDFSRAAWDLIKTGLHGPEEAELAAK